MRFSLNFEGCAYGVIQLNEAELEVDSDKASYKQKLEVLQQQEELIEDEKEQEQKEEDARRARKEEEARMAESLLPESEVMSLGHAWFFLALTQYT